VPRRRILGAHGGLKLAGAWAVRHAGGLAERDDGVDDLLAVPERLDADLLELVNVEVEQHLAVDVVLLEERHVRVCFGVKHVPQGAHPREYLPCRILLS